MSCESNNGPVKEPKVCVYEENEAYRSVAAHLRWMAGRDSDFPSFNPSFKQSSVCRLVGRDTGKHL